MFYKLKKSVHIAVLVCILAMAGCNFESNLVDEQGGHDYVVKNLTIADLIHTDNFQDGALEHILEGELNARGQAVGFHYDGLPSKKGKIIEGTETPLNKNDVYEAKIEVNGVPKTSYEGKSSFFPDSWSAQEVIDAINEAYDGRVLLSGNTYEGITKNGMDIRMYLDNNEMVISAFPVY